MSDDKNKVIATVTDNTVKVTANPITTRVSTTDQVSGTANVGDKIVSVTISNDQTTASGVGIRGERGITWRGSWADTLAYSIGDAVYYDGRAYINTQGITSGDNTPADTLSNWDILSDRGIQGEVGETGADSQVEGPRGLTGLGERGEKGLKGDTGADSQVPGIQGLRGSTGPSGDKGDTGSTGRKGDDGTTGSKGNIGSQGETGIQGKQGERGGTGSEGRQGNKGDAGRTGATGEKGSKGNTGSTGSKGADGSQGQRGFQGSTGEKGADSTVKGATGQRGLTGATGQQGNTGERGETGGKGNTGSQGLTGSRGTQGSKGDTGSTGRAGSDGVDGSKGDTGGKGNDGATGQRGLQGSRGEKGADSTVKGDTGRTGARGAVGADGQDGEKGDTGADSTERGPTGLTGSRGIQGEKGDTGSTGRRGQDGADGQDGQDGTDGDKGDTGAQGLIGPRGLKGDKGDIGATGRRGQDGTDGLDGGRGAQGETGSRGLVGPQGDSYLWASGAADPLIGFPAAHGRSGEIGDLYFETDALRFWEFKVDTPQTNPAGSWVEIANIDAAGRLLVAENQADPINEATYIDAIVDSADGPIEVRIRGYVESYPRFTLAISGVPGNSSVYTTQSDFRITGSAATGVLTTVDTINTSEETGVVIDNSADFTGDSYLTAGSYTATATATGTDSHPVLEETTVNTSSASGGWNRFVPAYWVVNPDSTRVEPTELPDASQGVVFGTNGVAGAAGASIYLITTEADFRFNVGPYEVFENNVGEITGSADAAGVSRNFNVYRMGAIGSSGSATFTLV